MDKFLLLEIVTPEGLVFSGEVQSVQLPGVEGELGILPSHAPVITTLNTGVIEIVDKNDKKVLVAVKWGYLKVAETKTTVLVDGAVVVGGDSENAIAKSLQKAKDLLESISSENSTYLATMAKIDEHVRRN